jgi:hypothetical protein
MSNLVERLRKEAERGPLGWGNLLREAAAEIELLLATITAQAAEIADINRELARLREQSCKLYAEIERLRELKTPASRELLNITKGLLDAAETEIERMRKERDALYEEWRVNPS